MGTDALFSQQEILRFSTLGAKSGQHQLSGGGLLVVTSAAPCFTQIQGNTEEFYSAMKWLTRANRCACPPASAAVIVAPLAGRANRGACPTASAAVIVAHLAGRAHAMAFWKARPSKCSAPTCATPASRTESSGRCGAGQRGRLLFVLLAALVFVPLAGGGKWQPVPGAATGSS